jgi:ferredoxin-thioredoxin reductase catalytic chain
LTSINEIRQRAEADAKTNGCYLNTDPSFLNDLFEGLKQNEERYGYPSCPCRLASGKFEFDRDIVCPCDYRDPDVQEFGACYCALYVRKDVFDGKTTLQPVVERRPREIQDRAFAATPTLPLNKPSEKAPSTVTAKVTSQIPLKMWYCKQCGYVCLRETPPYICPICKAKREMFAEVTIRAEPPG